MDDTSSCAEIELEQFQHDLEVKMTQPKPALLYPLAEINSLEHPSPLLGAEDQILGSSKPPGNQVSG
jgi:hypothetical protein